MAGTQQPQPQPQQQQQQQQQHNAQTVYELQRKWRKPTTTLGRLRLFMKTLLFQTDYIMGAYFFDWWETLFVYSFYFMLLVIACVSAYKQMRHGWEFAQSLMGADKSQGG